MRTMVTASYRVDGIDCDHCVRAVLGELSRLDTRSPR